MKVRIEVEIKDELCSDLQAELVAQLYQQCLDWVEEDTPPMLQFICDSEEIEDDINMGWYGWGSQFDDTLN